MKEQLEAVWLDPGDVFYIDDPDEILRYASHQGDDVLAYGDNKRGVLLPGDMIITRIATR